MRVPTDRELPAREEPSQRKFPLLMLVPLAAFLALASFFAVSLRHGDPTRLPSVLVGKPVPAFKLPPVEDLRTETGSVPGFAQADLLSGKVSLVNVWASWCTPCVAEHPYLTQLAKDSGVPLFGINYKDKPENARRFLGRYGNPFTAVGADVAGRTAIEWGVTGVPETFVVDAQGRVAYKHVGPISPQVIDRDLMPAILRASR